MLPLLIYFLFFLFNLGAVSYSVYKIHNIQKLDPLTLSYFSSSDEEDDEDEESEEEQSGRENEELKETPEQELKEIPEQEQEAKLKEEEEVKELLEKFMSEVQANLQTGKPIQEILKEIPAQVEMMQREHPVAVQKADEYSLAMMNKQGLEVVTRLQQLMPLIDKIFPPERISEMKSSLGKITSQFMEFEETGNFDHKTIEQTLSEADDTIEKLFAFNEQVKEGKPKEEGK